MKKIFQFLTALLFALSLSAQAEIVDTFQFKNDNDRARAVELAKSLRCPQCQNQNLVESNSPIAYDLRIEVYKMVDEGKSNQQIVDAMTARFGNFVNYKPPFQWNTALLWLLPVLLLIVAFGLIWHASRTQKLGENSPHFSADLNLAEGKDNTPKSHWQYSLAVFALLLAVPLAYYFSLARFETVQQGEQLQIAKANERVEVPEMDQNAHRMAKIQDKLREDPNDSERWLQLGELYVENNQFDNALIAYGNAAQIAGDKPNILGLAATALYYQSGQRITANVQALLDRALAQDKNEISSLSLLAAAAFEQQDYQTALGYWQQLLDSGNAAVDRRSVIQRMKMVQFLERGK